MHIYIKLQHVCNSGITLWNSGKEIKDIENDRKSTILRYIASVQVDDIIAYTECC
jgi:hypothetical protein